MGSPEWASWLREQKRAGRFESHYEYTFAQKVLSRVPGLSPDHVTPQQEFVDVNGRTRRMDFAIVRNGQRVAVEVDGFDKKGNGGGMTSAEHADYALRERSMTAEGWQVLRFANREIYDDAQALSMQIWVTLNPKEGDAAGTTAEDARAEGVHVPLTAPAEADADAGQAGVRPSPVFDEPSPEPPTQAGTPGWRGRATWALAAVGAAAVAIVVIVSVAGGDPETEPATQPGVDPISVDDCPADAPIKGNISEDGEQIFHQASDEFYDRTNPEICFASTADAEAAGFRAARR